MKIRAFVGGAIAAMSIALLPAAAQASDVGDLGCTYTQGYWKNHPEAWPARIPNELLFYNSGKSWLEVLQTPVKGSTYYSLAHQYAAAKLNYFNGAVPNIELQFAGAWSDKLFNSITPSTRLSTEQLTEMKRLIGVFDDFNQGLTQTPHC